jgi:hypothetical protein
MPVVLELRKAIREDTREGRSHGANEVEDGISLLKLIPRIPTAEKIGAA